MALMRPPGVSPINILCGICFCCMSHDPSRCLPDLDRRERPHCAWQILWDQPSLRPRVPGNHRLPPPQQLLLPLPRQQHQLYTRLSPCSPQCNSSFRTCRSRFNPCNRPSLPSLSLGCSRPQHHSQTLMSPSWFSPNGVTPQQVRATCHLSRLS